MTILTILSTEEIQLFETPPQYTAEERKHFFTLPKWAEEIVATLQTPVSKIGFILQLGYFRATKKFYTPHTFHQADIQFVARRLAVEATYQFPYAKATIHRHRVIIREKLGYSPFSATTEALLTKEIDFLLSKQMRLKDIFGTLLQVLEQQKVEIPSFYKFAELITDSFRTYEKRLLTSIENSLRTEDKQLLDSLLQVDEVYTESDKQDLKIKRYAITLLKRPNQSTKPAKIKANIHDLLTLKELFEKLQQPIAALSLSPDMIWHYATIVIKTEIFQIARRDEKRYLYLLCFIIHQYYSLQDLLIDVVLKVVQSADNAAKRKQKDTYFAMRTDRGNATSVLTCVVENAQTFKQKVTEIVLSQHLTPEQKLAKLEALVKQNDTTSPEDVQKTLALLKTDTKKLEKDGDYYEALQDESLRLQQRATEIIKNVSFNPETSRKGITEAITYFVQTDGKIGDEPPTDFLNKKEKQIVLDSHKRIRVSLYKMLLFQNIADATKSGSLNLKHSYRYRSLDEYMIAKEDWQKNRVDYLKRAGLEKFVDCTAVLKDLEDKLDKQYATTNNNILTGENQHITIHGDHQFTLTTPKQEETNETAIDLFPQTRFVSLCEVLATIQRVTGFLGAFSHMQLTHIHQKPADKLFYAGITGLGCNITIAKLAQISKEINQSTLERTVLTYFTHENILEAIDIILAYAKKLPLSHIFDRPDGLIITASDGQKLGVHGESLLANSSYKYFGKEQGITAYTFRDIHDFLYHSTIFSPSDREAMYVIDGMMHNTIVRSDMHATDTHGVTSLTFAAMHFLGIFFAPRIARLDERKLYSFLKRKVYQEQGYKLLPDNTINVEIIKEHWDDILRFMATIILKVTPASQLFERLNSYSHQNPLYKALKEFGQIVETLFILRYIDEPDIRQSVEKELNKLEHTNKFAKAVFHDNNHEFRQET
ncbi:MAG TPA: Tn3 family transposase, partial [Methylomirabilota bacterium]|nr:Tn3 family transposase [Methylomirabilota bacterium]